MAIESEKSEHTVTTRTMDIIVALLFMGVAGLVMADSWRIGARWASDGPEAGYFPFYVGVIMFVASLGTLGTSIFTKSPNLSNFVDREQLGSVLKVLVPTIVYVVLINFIGIYIASMIFIAFFMWWLGKYSPLVIAPVAIGVPAVLFVMFEIWFLVPLPKGPIETALGY